MKAMTTMIVLMLASCGAEPDATKTTGATNSDGPQSMDQTTNGPTDEPDEPDQPDEPLPAWPLVGPVDALNMVLDVFALDADHALFSGAEVALYAWQDAGFHQLDSPTSGAIHGVWAPDAATFYLAASDGVWFWDGTAYHQVVRDEQMMDVWGLPGGSRVWAVGDDTFDSGAGLIYVGYATEFAEEYRVSLNGNYTRALHSIWVSPTGSAVAAGWAEDGALWLRGEQGWQSESPTGPITYNAVHGLGDEIWAVGFKYTVAHFDGREWTRTGIGGQYVNAVFATGPGRAWVGADEGLYRFQDGASAERALEDVYIASLHGSGATDIWAVGGRQFANEGWIYRFDGLTWTQLLPTPSAE